MTNTTQPPQWIHRNELEAMDAEQIVTTAKELYQWLATGSLSFRQCYWNMFGDATNAYFAKVGRKLTAEELR